MCAKKFFVLIALLGTSIAQATPSFLHITPYSPTQDGRKIRLGLAVEGHTAWHTLTVGGGFTVACESASLQIVADYSLPTSSIFGNLRLTITVPQTVPTDYNIPGYQSLSENECRECSFLYRGSAVDGSASIATSGLGGNFSFNIGGAISESNTIFFNICQAPANCNDGGGSNPSKK